MPPGHPQTGEATSGAFVVVTGCYAQLKPETVAKIEGVDVVLGAEQKKDLLHYLGNLQKHETGEAYTSALKDIRSFAPSCSRGDRTRFFLKVQDGCDYYCSYCTIPFARGRTVTAALLLWWSRPARRLPKVERKLY